MTPEPPRRPGRPAAAAAVPWGAGDVAWATLTTLALLVAIMVPLALARGAGDRAAAWLSEGELLGLSVSIALAAILEAVLLAVALWFAVVRRGAAVRLLGFFRPQGPAPYALALGAWLGGIVAAGAWVWVTRALGWGVFEPEDSAREVIDAAGGGLIVPYLIVGVFGPFCEEVFFRGFALPGLGRRFGTWRAVALSAALFGLFHISPGLVVPTFIFGIVFGWLYVRTGSILPGILAHSLQNIVALTLVS